ncbi:tetratricopeptide repeat protein [uncultured Desulfosarcina sp.]|uniref:tetratricopeptide repeat protein n=1 Tax=uncultured Desulfosarcina sp. TaxID=218289 RepID=UPI0029C6940E|nr:tetratricopeptide repeat protein [uncultured Desulfosarcina sp.]
MKHKYLSVGLGVILLILSGCQTSQAPREMDKQANAYIEQAQAYEGQGHLLEALEQFKLAQTIAPEEPVVTEGIQRLEKQLGDLAEKHYQAGLRYRDKGQWESAKKEFLKALYYRPDHEKAAAMLQQRQPEEGTKYITHQIKAGESISKLALKYYGDYKKYHHIANFNKLTDVTRVRVGQEIRIPVINGVSLEDLIRISNKSDAASQAAPEISGEYVLHEIQPGESLSIIAKKYYGDYKLYRMIADYNGIDDPTSVKVGQKVKVPRLEAAEAPQAPVAEPEPAEPEQPQMAPETAGEYQPEAEEPVDQVAGYRETGVSLFEDKQYEDAIVEFQKVLSADPNDSAAKAYISRSYLELGKDHLAAGRIDDAKSALTTALDYDGNCSECTELLARSQSTESGSLLEKGEELLRSNQYDQAIETLKQALALNPDDDAATDLLFQTYYQKATILYDKQDYLAAREAFQEAVAIKPDCSDCAGYIESSLEEYKELNYNQGIVYFGQEELNQAIESWEKVVAVDPDYKDVQQNLKKAKLLNERLERIKSSSGD